jgi:hypothetical protein
LPDYFDYKNNHEVQEEIYRTLKQEYSTEKNKNLMISARDRRLLKGIFTTNRQELGVLHCLEFAATEKDRKENGVAKPDIDK